MRFYPTSDIHHYWEFPSGWTHYCYKPNKTWRRRPQQKDFIIAHWRDLEAAQVPIIKKKDLYMKDWPLSRISSDACLPLYYCVGHRYIRLQRAFPAGFKCAPMPLNLQEAQELRAAEIKAAKKPKKGSKKAEKNAKK